VSSFDQVRALMPAILALLITAVWSTMILRGITVPDALSNAEFTVLAFFFGSRGAEITRDAVASAVKVANANNAAATNGTTDGGGRP